jgi:hypothetical protein
MLVALGGSRLRAQLRAPWDGLALLQKHSRATVTAMREWLSGPIALVSSP